MRVLNTRSIGMQYIGKTEVLLTFDIHSRIVQYLNEYPLRF